ncbi:hypothetical protein JCM9279_004477 [Rhodotorula babjevae]
MDAPKLYTLLHHHLDQGHYSAALKVTAKLLALDPKDDLAIRTRAQLLVALDRYSDALHLDSTPHQPSLRRAYCLYKLARTHDAQHTLAAARGAQNASLDDRAADVLQAQLHYRLGQYDTARDLFDDLAATAEPDSPELADLHTNSSAATAHLDFAASVPSVLAHLAGAHRLASTDDLEARPLAAVLPAASTSSSSAPHRSTAAAVASTSTSGSSSSATAPARARTAKGKGALPASYDAARPASALASDRWVPKRERPSMRDALLQAKERARGKKRDRVARETGTQGDAGAGAGGAGAAPSQGQQGKAGGGAGGGAGGKKKKGRK